MPTTPVSTYNSSFGFSPIGDTAGFGLDDQKDNTKAMEDSSNMIESNKLRILLTKPSNAADNASSEGKSGANDHKILKGLLKQQDDDEGDGRRSGRNSIAGSSQMGDSSKTGPCGANKLLEKVGGVLFYNTINECHLNFV